MLSIWETKGKSGVLINPSECIFYSMQYELVVDSKEKS